MAILDPPPAVDDLDLLTQSDRRGAGRRRAEGRHPTRRPSAASAAPSDGGFGTFYFPWIVVGDAIGPSAVNAPPSGHLAGVWARTDATRGVHKAPANEPVRGALDLTYRVTREEQDELNPRASTASASSPARASGSGAPARWPAEASEWRYLNVRRLFNMFKESIGDGTRWIVFEPNDRTLWSSIRRDVGAFLTRVWRDGALLGRTPQEAFFVKCDDETNPADVRDAGQVVTLIGVATGEAGRVRGVQAQPVGRRRRDRADERRMAEDAAPTPDPPTAHGPAGNLVDPYRAYNFKLRHQRASPRATSPRCSGLGVQGRSGFATARPATTRSCRRSRGGSTTPRHAARTV